MPQWLDPLRVQSSPLKWRDQDIYETSLNVMTSNDIQGSTIQVTPTTTTAIDLSLPPPVLQSSTSSSHIRRLRKKTARVNGLSVHWVRFKRRMGTGTAPSSSSFIGESAAEHSYIRKIETTETPDYLDEVVVDRSWTEEIKSSVSHSDHGGSPEKLGGSHQPNQGTSDYDSVVYDGFWNSMTILAVLRWRIWPLIMEIFSSRFVDEKSEQHYAQVSSLILSLRLPPCKDSSQFRCLRKVGSSRNPSPSGHPFGSLQVGFWDVYSSQKIP